MDLLIIAVAFALCFGVSATLWYAWVRPDLLFSLFDPSDPPDPLAPPSGPAVAWLRVVLGGAVFVISFVTGAVVVLLAQTSGRHP